MLNKVIIPWSEIEFSATRSTGAGGQHVNKTNSCIQLKFDMATSNSLSDDQKIYLQSKLSNRLVRQTEIHIRVEDQRDQKSNKDQAYKMLNELINRSLIKPKKRIATKPKKSSIRKRLSDKKTRGEVKKNRSSKIAW